MFRSVPAPGGLDALLPTLSLDQKIAQLLHVTIGHASPEKIETVIQYEVGAYFQGHAPWRKLREARLEMDARMSIPPLGAGDYECSVAILEGISLGSAMTLGAIANLDRAESITYSVGRSCAIQGRAVGTNWTLAPAVDLNLHHDNPITNIRSFGEEVERVERLSTAFIRGAQDHGMAATPKHFPGDGADWIDQHVSTSNNPLPPEEWERTFGRAFRSAFEAGAFSVMMGHISLGWASSRCPRSGMRLPGTLDPVLHNMIREQFDFDGLIVSDAIPMGGVQWHCRDETEAAVRNLIAGSDMVLFPKDVPAAIEGVKEALDQGRISLPQVDASVRRVLRMKEMLGLFVPGGTLMPEEEATAVFSDQKDQRSLAMELARLSVTKVRDLDGRYPWRIRPGRRVLVFPLPGAESDGVHLHVNEEQSNTGSHGILREALQRLGIPADVVRNPNQFREKQDNADAVIYLFPSRPQAGRNSIRLTYPAMQFIEQTRSPERISRFYVSLGSPYVLEELPNLPNFTCLYSSLPNAIEAYAEAFCGEAEFQGRLPVKLAV